MQNFSKYALVSLSILLLTACGTKTANKNQKTETPKTEKSEMVKIGAVAPLTGDAAVYGILLKNVAQLKIDEINAKGGIQGKKVKLIWEDGKCNPADASKAAQKLVNIDQVKIIFGGACSGETLAIAPITEKNKIILFSALSTSPEITKAGDFVFRTAPSDSSQGKVLADYATSKYKKIGIISEQTDYALAIKETFKKHYTGEIIEETYLSTESDFKTRITKLKNSDIEALVILPQSPTKFEIIAKQLQEQKWEKPMIVNEVAGGNIEMVLKFKDFFDQTTLITANFLAPQSTEMENFIQQYQVQFSQKPSYPNYAAVGVDLFDILFPILEKVGTQDTEKIRDELYQIKKFNGLSGKNLKIDTNGDINIYHQLMQFDGEAFQVIQEETPL